MTLRKLIIRPVAVYLGIPATQRICWWRLLWFNHYFLTQESLIRQFLYTFLFYRSPNILLDTFIPNTDCNGNAFLFHVLLIGFTVSLCLMLQQQSLPVLPFIYSPFALIGILFIFNQSDWRTIIVFTVRNKHNQISGWHFNMESALDWGKIGTF